MGSYAGVEKIAAKRLGLTLYAYKGLLEAGQKWCTACKEWKHRSAFCIDKSRGSGLAAKCRRCGYHPIDRAHLPKINPLTGRPGQAKAPIRCGDKRQARHAINLEVRSGRRPRPNTLLCTDCNHQWKTGERRHEYDHYLGYTAEHHYVVQPVCTTCHAAREKRRRLNG